VENYYYAYGGNHNWGCYIKNILDCGDEFCYEVTPYGTPWNNVCEGIGGEFVSIHSVEENNYFHSLCSSYCWIGLSFSQIANAWIWRDGSKVNYTNWDTDEPSNTTGNEHYVQINSDGTWSAKDGSNTIRAICKSANTPAPNTGMPTKMPTPVPNTTMPTSIPTPAPNTAMPTKMPTSAPNTGMPTSIPTPVTACEFPYPSTSNYCVSNGNYCGAFWCVTEGREICTDYCGAPTGYTASGYGWCLSSPSGYGQSGEYELGIDVNECADLCTSTPGCPGFSYYSSNSSCRLQSQQIENYFSAHGGNASVRCFVKDILDCDHEFCYEVTPYGTP